MLLIHDTLPRSCLSVPVAEKIRGWDQRPVNNSIRRFRSPIFGPYGRHPDVHVLLSPRGDT